MKLTFRQCALAMIWVLVFAIILCVLIASDQCGGTDEVLEPMPAEERSVLKDMA